MARISGNYSVTSRAARGANEPNSPQAALRRLRLGGVAAESFQDVIQLDLDGFRGAVRAIDAERQSLELTHARAAAADAALETIGQKLSDIEKLAADNAKSGLSRQQRRANQSRIDALLKEINRAAAEPGPDGQSLFDGGLTLAAATESIDVPRVSPADLGRVSLNGRTLHLKDVATRGALDTSTRKASTIDQARRSIKAAAESVKTLRDRLNSFDRDTLRPRLGDVAAVMEGLYETVGVERLGSSESAAKVLLDLRAMTLRSATAATTAGADGWDREHLLALLTP